MDIEKQYEEKFPAKDYIRRTFAFSAQELRELSSLDTIIKMGQLAQRMSNNFVENVSMARVKAKNSPDTGLLYNYEKGEFYIWEPKMWCSMCSNRKAEYQFKEKIYCKDCIEILRNQEVQKLEEKPEEKPKKAKP